MLKFIGTGSAFRTDLGNNSAYIKERDSFLLIDCGGTVFHSMKNEKILEDLKKVYILITHTHLDHIGSLGDFIFYCHYVLKIKPVIYYPGERILSEFLNISGVQREMYELKGMRNVEIHDENFGKVKIIFNSGSHVPQMVSYSILLKIMDESIYYSGDSNYLPAEVLEKAAKNEITKIYEDTCGLDYEKNPHLSFKKLCSLVKDVELRKKIYCMHLDDAIDENEIIKEGFNIVK